jgi:hypothetical protein
MSIPLLSVALATLMALFRDPRLSHNVTQDVLALLIREAGKALLDPRLAMSSHHESQLDESTSSQMVRAINKASALRRMQKTFGLACTHFFSSVAARCPSSDGLS